MAAAEKSTGVIYRCPACLGALVDVVIDKYEDGQYRCVKCGYSGTLQELQQHYGEFRSRYHLLAVRLTLEEQRRL